MRRTHFICVLCILAATGCVKVKQKTDDAKAPEPNIPSTTVETAVVPVAPVSAAVVPEIKVFPQAEVNSYQVRILIPPDINIIRRQEKNTSEVKNFAFTAGQAAWSDVTVVPGATYTYTLGRTHGDELTIVKEFQVDVPRDLVIENDFTVPEKFNWMLYERLFVLKGSKIITQGQNFKFQMSEIYFENTVFLSFPTGTKAATGFGRSGGKIEIYAGKIRGQLSIQLNGENGSDGIDGAPHETFARGGYAGSGYEGPCIAGSIVRGEDGKRGKPGGSGGAGGSTGQVTISTLDDSEFTWSVASQVGRGGLRGIGGPGQAGGPTGTMSPGCGGVSTPIPGGQAGAPGTDGLDGRDGEYRQSCVSKNSKTPSCS